MIKETHIFQKRGLNGLDENGNAGCARCGRPRDHHPDDEIWLRESWIQYVLR